MEGTALLGLCRASTSLKVTEYAYALPSSLIDPYHAFPLNMPPAKRRRTSTPQTSSNKSRQQGQLSFRSTKNGIRRPEAVTDKLQKSEDGAAVKHIKGQEKAATTEPDVETKVPQEPATEDIPEQDQAESEEDEDVEALHQEALKMPESKLKAYWAGKEGERKAPRVHQEKLSVHEKILREFDMSSRFGSVDTHLTEAEIYANICAGLV